MFEKLFTSKKKEKDFDFFEMLKMFNQLTHQKDKIYEDNVGKKFILTRYGFYPVEQYNLHIENKELNKTINVLNSNYEKLLDKYEKSNNEIDLLKKAKAKSKKTINILKESVKVKTNVNQVLYDKNLELIKKIESKQLFQEIVDSTNLPKERQEKLLEKVKKMTEMLENLKEKSRNQKDQITNLLKQLEEVRKNN